MPQPCEGALESAIGVPSQACQLYGQFSMSCVHPSSTGKGDSCFFSLILGCFIWELLLCGKGATSEFYLVRFTVKDLGPMKLEYCE